MKKKIVKRHYIRCKHCGGLVPSRAVMGEGTQRGRNMELNTNRKNILEVLKKSKEPLDVRGVQTVLHNSKIIRESRRGAGWNYHTVQVDLSILLAQQKVRMVNINNNAELFSGVEGFSSKSIPFYAIVKETKKKKVAKKKKCVKKKKTVKKKSTKPKRKSVGKTKRI